MLLKATAAAAVAALLIATGITIANHAGKSKTSDPLELTAEERLTLRDGIAARQQAVTAEQGSKEELALRVAQAAAQQNKEFKLAQDLTVKAEAAWKAYGKTKEAEAVKKAGAAVEQSAEVQAAKDADQFLRQAVDGVLSRRKLSNTEYIVCAGPAQEQPACKDVPAKDLAIRKLSVETAKK